MGDEDNNEQLVAELHKALNSPESPVTREYPGPSGLVLVRTVSLGSSQRRD